MIDLEYQKKCFKDHVATFTDYGNIKILDFQRPGSIEYRIRFLFEEDYCKLHISGDLGELTATNYKNMRYESFGDFLGDLEYFKEKIDCCERAIYKYDAEKAEKDLIFNIDEFGGGADSALEASGYDDFDELIGDILEDFDGGRGIGTKGYDVLTEVISDAWEIVGDIGKEETGILELYLLAFKLAQEDLKKQAGEQE